MPKSSGVDIEEDRAFAESAGCSWSWYFVDPSKLHARMNVAALIREMCGGVQTRVSTDGAVGGGWVLLLPQVRHTRPRGFWRSGRAPRDWGD